VNLLRIRNPLSLATLCPEAFGYNQVMVRELEAVFENGVLRPLEPLSLAEKQHVRVTITEADAPAPEKIVRGFPEQEWLIEHQREYPGQWLALDGHTLLSHGSDAFAVRDEARGKGVPRPLLVHIPEEPDLPSAGWL
jgi:predicted DNA-binding antitoxin AbrB/MazE fold protein